MTKENNGKVLRWASFVIVAGGLLAGLVTTWTVYGKDITQNTKEVSDLATRGCAPAQAHITDIALIQRDIEYIKDAQDKGFKAIIERLEVIPSIQATKTGQGNSSNKGPKT